MIAGQGFDRLCPGKRTFASCQEEFDDLAKFIKYWCYTFMYPGYCETKEEMKISLVILFAFLDSSQVLKCMEMKKDYTVFAVVHKYCFCTHT